MSGYYPADSIGCSGIDAFPSMSCLTLHSNMKAEPKATMAMLKKKTADTKTLDW